MEEIDRGPFHRFRLKLLVCIAGIASASGCQDENRHVPRLDAIAADRIASFTKAVEIARTLPDGDYDHARIPNDFPIAASDFYVRRGQGYAFRFPSLPLETDPVYVFVEPSVSDSERWVRDFILGRGWRYGRKLDNPGWHYVHGN